MQKELNKGNICAMKKKKDKSVSKTLTEDVKRQYKRNGKEVRMIENAQGNIVLFSSKIHR